MPRRKRYDVFVSYSHKDAATVKPLVGVLSIAKRRVFWDEIIQPGQEWNREIETALAASDAVVIMWCCDSAASDWVTREIATARKLGKALTPIRLCGFPLSGPAVHFQAIDLSGKVNHNCDCALTQAAEQRERDEPARQSRLPLQRLLLGVPLRATSTRAAHFWTTIRFLSRAVAVAVAGYAIYKLGYWRIALGALLVVLAAAILLLALIAYLDHRAELRKRRISKTISLITDALRTEASPHPKAP